MFFHIDNVFIDADNCSYITSWHHDHEHWIQFTTNKCHNNFKTSRKAIEAIQSTAIALNYLRIGDTLVNKYHVLYVSIDDDKVYINLKKGELTRTIPTEQIISLMEALSDDDL